MIQRDDGIPGTSHILYVNDEADFAELTRAKLLNSSPDVEVTTVATAEAALDRLDTDAIDCVVTSYSLPDSTGIDLLERIRSERDELPTILFTGRGSEQIASEATRAGVSDYIPIRAEQNNFELLARRIQTFVEAAHKKKVAEQLSTRFHRTLERTTDAIYAVDSDWRIEYMNEKMAARVDRDPDTVVGAILWEEFPSIVGTDLEDRYRTAMETGEPVSFEQRLGEPFDYWVEGRAFPDEDGLTVFSREITAERERELERERDALRELQTVMAKSGVPAETRLEKLLEVGCRTLDLKIGIVSQIQASNYTVEAVHAPDAEIEAGDRFDLESTYCEAVVEQDTVCSFADAVADGKAIHPAYREFELESYIGVPLVVDGERYGTVNFSSPTTRVAPFGTLERTFVELLAELVSAEISRGRDRAELERQEFLFKRVQDIADIGVWEYAPSADGLEWSDGVRRIHGVDEGYEPSLDDGIEFYHPDDRETIAAAVDRAIEDGDPYDLDLRIVRADGAVRDVRAWGERFDGTQHDDPVLRGVFQDVTERQAQQREYHELAEEYEALLNTTGDAIFLLDVDTAGEDPSFEFARLSPGYETQTGLTTADVQGESPRAVFGDERGGELEANYTRCVERRAPISYREELGMADDARFWETSLAPVIVDGELVRIVGIARNITEQVERERHLETTNKRLESLIEATPLTVMEIDADGNVIRWNDEAETMFGWSREEVLGEFNPMIPAQKQAEFASLRKRALNGERIRGKEIRRETKDGEELDLLLSVAPITGPDGDATSILAVLEDITEQKQLEARLRSLQETAQQFSGAESSEEIGTIAVDAAAEILDFDITGIWEYNEREDALVPITETPEARELFGDSPRFTPGDSLAWDAFESREIRVYDDVRTAGQPYNPNTEIQSEILVPLGDYGLISTGSVSTQVFSATDVDLFRLLGATVEAALARASREAELQRQNERLDEFASVVAHDLRNPLSIAIGFLEVVEETGDLDHLRRIESAHDRMERLIEDLLTLARGESTITDPERVDLETVATEAWGYVDTAGATLTVSAPVPTVAGDGNRLIQLFENLFRNAIQHGGEDVTVTVGQLEDDEGFYVEDDGDGVPLERREKVFEHGVTSNEGGTGFGLSIVADIAKAHGWTASVGDGSDDGARFEFAVAE